MKHKKRAFLIVLDGFGVGEAPDAKTFGDTDSNTFRHLQKVFENTEGRPLNIPNLLALGLDQISPTSLKRELAPAQNSIVGRTVFYGKAAETSSGKDTTSGHWEMMGLPVFKPFATFENGFPKEAIDEWVTRCKLPGVLGNISASGTEIIATLGEEHLRTLKPILYTSADSVWQIAAHETYFGLDKLNSIAKTAREICDRLNIGRVITRPFVGEPGKFKRTYNRKDLAQLPFHATWLDVLKNEGCHVRGVGKISNIYCAQGVSENMDTAGNADGISKLISIAQAQPTHEKEMIFCNLIDFDMLFGHRRDPVGFGKALEEFDLGLEKIRQSLGQNDFLVLTADHGNDPTYRGTDHTREFVPILGDVGNSNASPVALGNRTTFADIGASIADFLLGESFETVRQKYNPSPTGQTFIKQLL